MALFRIKAAAEKTRHYPPDGAGWAGLRHEGSDSWAEYLGEAQAESCRINDDKIAQAVGPVIDDSADAQLQSVLIGFEGKQLRRLDILDSFGQRSLIEFGNFTPLPAKTSFQYKPPAGADIIKQ